jgi:aspartate-semialdehyde dehydrogenase
MASEPRKLLGLLIDGKVEPAPITISAQCNRVPVLEGHLECVSVKFKAPVDPEAVVDAFRNWRSPIDYMELPTAPESLLHVFDDPRYPQPRRHVELGRGMTVSVGRIRPCEVRDVKFVVLVHNTLRGAAGGAVLNAELLVEQGYLTWGDELASASARMSFGTQ